MAAVVCLWYALVGCVYKTPYSCRMVCPMTAVGSVQDCISFFTESASLQKEPAESYLDRVYILRLLFSLDNINVDSTIEALTDAGVLVGNYDSEHLHAIHFQQKLTQWNASETFQFLSAFAVDSFDDIVNEMLVFYQDDTVNSPFLALKRVFEENFGDASAFADMFVALFFAVHNCECARDSLMVMIFERLPRLGNSQEMVLKILGSAFQSRKSHQNLQTDVCFVVQFLQVRVQEHVDLPKSDAGAPGGAGVLENRQSRCKLLKIRERVVADNARRKAKKGDGATAWKPQGLPVSAEEWGLFSRARQHSIILLSSMAPHAVEDIDDLIDIILLENQPDSGHADRSFARYQPAFNDTENIVNSVHGLLTRFTHVVDTGQATYFLFIDSFVQNCFESSFGVNQLSAMSLSLKVQIFFCCHLVDRVRKPLFRALMTAFNHRAFANDVRNHLPTAFTRHIEDLIDKWLVDNKFPADLVTKILKPLCI